MRSRRRPWRPSPSPDGKRGDSADPGRQAEALRDGAGHAARARSLGGADTGRAASASASAADTDDARALADADHSQPDAHHAEPLSDADDPQPDADHPEPVPHADSEPRHPTKRVNCPADLLDLELNLLGNKVIVQVGLNLDITIGGITIVIPANCPTGGPPHPFPLPSLRRRSRADVSAARR